MYASCTAGRIAGGRWATIRVICSRSKKPVRTFRSFSIGMCETWVSFPFCRARLKMRFSVVSSRLISPLEYLRSSRLSSSPTTITSFWRFKMNAFTSAVLIAERRRPPK